MKKTILLIVGFLVLVGTAYYAWDKRHEYFFKGENEIKIEKEKKKESGDEKDEKEIIEDNNQGLPSPDEDGSGTENATGNSEAMNDSSKKPTAEYCDNECFARQGEDDYKYCLEVCGFNDSQEGEDEGEGDENDEKEKNCEEMTGFEKDSCFRQKAINEKNAGICDKISDADLKENCHNRVIEELFE